MVGMKGDLRICLTDAEIVRERGFMQDVDLKANAFEVTPCRRDGITVTPLDHAVASPTRDLVVKLLVAVLGEVDVGL